MVTESARACSYILRVRRYIKLVMSILAVNVLAVNILVVNCPPRPPPLYSAKKCIYALHSVESAALTAAFPGTTCTREARPCRKLGSGWTSSRRSKGGGGERPPARRRRSLKAGILGRPSGCRLSTDSLFMRKKHKKKLMFSTILCEHNSTH